MTSYSAVKLRLSILETRLRVVRTQELKSHNDSINDKSFAPLQLFSPDFCHLLNDVDYIRATSFYENAITFLSIMWTPTSSGNLSSPFAVTKYKLLNSYVSTHGKLPSEECFLPWERDKINRLAFKWIGNAPLQRDVEHIVRFMRNFNDLFLFSNKGKRLDDPIERKKLEVRGQFLVGLLDTIRPNCSTKPMKSNTVFIPETESANLCVPLQWKDLRKQWNVIVQEAPDGRQFLYNEKMSRVRKRTAAVVVPLQEGFCYSKAYPTSELKLDHSLVRDSSPLSSRRPYHRLTRAKFRALQYVRCHCPETKRMVCPLCPEPEDLQYEELVRQLPEHKCPTWSLHESSSRVCDSLILRPLPRWLRRDPRIEPLTVDPPRPCPPSPSNPNRRAFDVNPHIPFHPPKLKPCLVHNKTRTPMNAKEKRDANVSNTCRRRQPTKLPPILLNRLKLA
ncbi:hypothetical protein TcWFU_005543 [Taenia crassiceps]|uniref:Uncharacterized protein n=1 Tax=Taenia crassiceps TaxID=6207 RepID=A0ABR4QLI1_9CEST